MTSFTASPILEARLAVRLAVRLEVRFEVRLEVGVGIMVGGYGCFHHIEHAVIALNLHKLGLRLDVGLGH